MQVNKTGLSLFISKAGEIVFAEKITRLELLRSAQKEHPGSTTLFFDEVDKKSHLLGTWVAENKPEIGGYFVVKDTEDGNGKAMFMSEELFEMNYERD